MPAQDSSSAVPKRSATGHHDLLPASESHINLSDVPLVPTRSFIGFTFGRGTVIWRIWPAVLMHTVFAAVVVTVSMKTQYKLDVPNVLLTLLGVVIGFVISYRASSGYDRYWQGRSCWSEVMRTSRTCARLIWFHVPLSFSPPMSNSSQSASKDGRQENEGGDQEGESREKEVHRIMAEKRMALDLVEGFSVALKHHLRGEMGMYYEDLYPLVKPLHEHANRSTTSNGKLPIQGSSNLASPVSAGDISQLIDPIIPPINSYRTLSTRVSRMSSVDSHHSSISDEAQPLLPNSLLQKRRYKGIMESIAGDLIPFNGFLQSTAKFLRLKGVHGDVTLADDIERGTLSRTHCKHRPKIAGGGENIPLEVLRALSCWLSVIENRGSVYGSTLGGLFGCISSFEDNLAALERILTTPLPFVFATHIRHTVWLYLFALPFQLIDQFGWYTIPGVCIAAFIYLGFIATGEEIEQPFGYDDNDLDIDLFCHAVIHADIEHVKRIPWKNVWLGPPHPIPPVDPIQGGKHGRIEELFGRSR
ncbi:Bestrophin, RFP-TM, chloride channel-domain-containing protein [Irpex rosettiformis]|uniref:Bestrophin, RFP-TM, chloride channel-domain-containing protein n=1 Tax=Irpex rosettiformis TaxID=378272 RepID=A0ACB8U9E2_9APHY|nr:Bestrophin, RFP-TM, chloride channel-domain-containing protein [Irpex rosettiformis]